MRQTPRPTSATQVSLEVLRAEAAKLEARISELTTQRAALEARAATLGPSGERARLGGQMRDIDRDISVMRSSLRQVNARITEQMVGEARAVTPSPSVPAPIASPPPTPFAAPPPTPTTSSSAPPGLLPPPPLNPDTARIGLLVALVILAPLSIALAIRILRRGGPKVTHADWIEHSARLERIERAVDTIAIEVERVSESQRFIAKTVAEEPKTLGTARAKPSSVEL
jgi:hypothetical protein